MPDLDKIERKLLPQWRPAYKLVKGGQPTEEVAHAVLSALARILREKGGAPALPEVARAVQRHDAGVLDDRSLAAFARRLERQMETRTGKVLAETVLRPTVFSPKSVLLGPPDERVAQEFLQRMVETGLFSQQRDYLVGKRFSSRQEALEFETQLLGLVGPELGQLAKSLAEDPSAKRLRAPRFRRARRKTTEELLVQPL